MALVKSPLHGQHLLYNGIEANLDFRMVRNISGFIVETKGVAVQMLQWLATYHSFTYSPLQVNVTPFEGSQNRLGMGDLIQRGELDIAVTISVTASRAAMLELSYPTLYIPVSFMRPSSRTAAVNLIAAIKPFQPWVWFWIFASYCAVLVSLKLLIWYYTPKQDSKARGYEDRSRKLLFGNQNLAPHLYGLLVHQAAGTVFSLKLAIRIVFGAWCIATLVLTEAYDSLLISYITAPNHQPLIKSIYELRTRPDVRLAVNKDFNMDVLFSSAKTGFFKELGDRLRTDPLSRCAPPKQCMDLVKEGKTIYSAGRDPILGYAIADDYNRTGKCSVEIAQENYMELQLTWAMRKNNPYTDYINKGTMRMRDAGLLTKWYEENKKNIRKCQEMRKTSDKSSDIKPLTLQNLRAAFVALLVGAIASTIVALGENALFRKLKKIRHFGGI